MRTRGGAHVCVATRLSGRTASIGPNGQLSCYLTLSGESPPRSHERDEGQSQGGTMNADILEGKWKQMRGEMQQWWGRLTDDDFDVIAGKRDKLIGKLQEKYGWAKRDAEDEVARRFRDIDATTRPSEPTGTSRLWAARALQ